jgi:glycyl-tRNA synthetase
LNDEKEDEKRIVLGFNAFLAPIDVAVLPLLTKEGLIKKSRDVVETLKRENLLADYDDSGSIGRRYRRQDEVGTPFCVTIDFETLEDDTVTIRERDTMKQIRVKKKDLPNVLRRLREGEEFLKGL